MVLQLDKCLNKFLHEYAFFLVSRIFIFTLQAEFYWNVTKARIY